MKLKAIFKNKQNFLNVGVLITVLLLSGCWDNNQSPKCNEDMEETQQTLSEWLKEAMVKKDAGAKDINAKIINMKDIQEYVTSPMLLGTTLYDNYKNSRICKAKAIVKFSGENIKGNRTKEIDVRYQITHSVDENNGILMAGPDVSDLGKDGVEKFVEAIREQTRDEMRALINEAPKTTPVLGNQKSKDDILVVFDFDCQYSQKLAEDIIELSKENEEVRFIFIPLGFVTELSPYLAKASLAAHQQGYFMQYYEAVMNKPNIRSEEDIDKLCAGLGMDMAKYNQAMAGNQLDKDVEAFMAVSQKINVKGTPSVYVNGYFVQNPTYYTITKELDGPNEDE